MNIIHEYLSGIIEHDGKFEIEQKDNGFVFKFLIVNDNVQYL